MIDIYQIPGILRKNLIWLIVLPLVCAMLALGFLATKTPVYRAKAQLLIEPQGLQIVGEDIVDRRAGESLQRLAVDSQTFVILSQAVLDEVVERLDLENDTAIIDLKVGLIDRLLGKTAPDLTAEEIRTAAIEGLRERLQATRIERAFVIDIYATHPDRFQAAAIANEAARAYLDEARRVRADATLRASVALQRQAADLKQRVETAEAAVENFRAENGLISTQQRGLVVDQQLQEINTQLTEARVELERAKSNADLLQRLTVTDIEAGALPVNLQTSTLDSLRAQFARAAEREAQAATTLGANHPQLRELRSQLDNTRSLIADELARVRRSVDSDLQRAEANVIALQGEAERLSSTNVDQNRAQIRLRQLESEAESLATVYKSFLARANELEEQQGIDTTNSRILSRAVAPLKPRGPSGLIVLAAAGVFGFVLAAGGGIAWEMVNGKLGSDRELVERTGVPLLARVTTPGAAGVRDGRLARLLPGADPRTEASERHLAITRIAYALRHAFADERPAQVLVVSAGPEPALSPLVRAIAMGLYDMGEDVLLARPRDAADEPDVSDAAAPARSRLSSRRRGGPAERDDMAPLPVAGGISAAGFRVERLDGRVPATGVDGLGAGDSEFLLVDGGSALSNPFLPMLLGECDAIVLVTCLGATRRQDLDRSLTLLQPWRDRMIGNVALAA